MPNIRQPRSGSLQFWPRKRSKRKVARIRTYPESKEPKLTGFAGYKVGMTHVMGIETNKYSHKKGEEISIPVTLIECPPLRIASVRLYEKKNNSLILKQEAFVSNNKLLKKCLNIPKKPVQIDKAFEKIMAEIKASQNTYDVRVMVFTQPGMTGIGQKKPHVFELSVGGSLEEKINYIKENIARDIYVDSIFQEGDLVDIKGITKGKGFQGPVKRFGISIRESKSEKAIRNPGSLGPWCGQGHIMWRVAHAGKMGHHQRTEYNKQILVIKMPDTEKNILKYGNAKNQIVMVKGSVFGPKKGIVVFQKAIRPKKKPSLPTIEK